VSGQDSPDSRAEGGEDPSAGSRGQLSADDQASASGGSAALERRYRRLLAWYPARHRSIYGDEMLGVLMAAATARGSGRPGVAESLNLIGSGLRARIGTIGTGTDPAWRDALAVYSLVAPVLVTAAIYRAPWFLSFLLWGRGGSRGGIDPLTLFHFYTLPLPFQLAGYAKYLITIASPLTPVVLGLLGLRRTGLLTAAVLLSWTALQASLSWEIQASNTVAFLALLAVEVVALMASHGPQRGLRLLTWKGLLIAAPLLALAVTAGLEESGAFGVMHLSWSVVVLAIIAMAATLASAKARRLLLLFAIPVSPFVILLVHPYETSAAVKYLAPAFLSLVTLFVSRRSRRKPSATGDLGQVA
jgi:hypothetical protein